MPRASFLLMTILYACFAIVTSFYCCNKWCLESNDNLNPVLMSSVRKNEKKGTVLKQVKGAYLLLSSITLCSGL